MTQPPLKAAEEKIITLGVLLLALKCLLNNCFFIWAKLGITLAGEQTQGS